MVARPAAWQIIFSLKAFATAMLALYIAFALDMDRPYWAMTTVYVVSQPFAGAIRSKGMYRIGGTLLGASAGIAFAGFFGTFQLGMIAALAVWINGCGYFALRDRSPKGYFFLLAGLTALLVGWPGSSLTPDTVFDTALARVQEIGLGILCTVAIDSIFFPRRVGPIIDSQLENWASDARQWAIDVLSGQRGKSAADRAKLAADASQIATMTIFLDYETQDNPVRARWLRALQRRMLMLLPVLSSVDDRLGELQRGGRPLPAPLAGIVAHLLDWLANADPLDRAPELKRGIETFNAREQRASDWEKILMVSLCERLVELIDIRTDCFELRAQARNPQRSPSPRVKSLTRMKAPATHVDHGMILWAIIASFLSFLVAASFWYFTGWDQGGGATMMALLMSLFFGGMDNPAPVLKMLLKVLLFGLVFDAVYLFIILPQIHSFPTLMLVFFPALIPLGIVASNPATFMVALMPIALMSLQNTAFTALASFVNGMVGTLVGVVIVFLVASVVKPVSAETSIRRILHAGWEDLEAIAAGQSRVNRARFTERMLDRLGLLAARLAAFGNETSLSAADALSDLRLGLNLIELQARRNAFSGEAERLLGALLGEVSVYFHRLRRGGAGGPPPPLLAHLDAVLESVAFGPDIPGRRKIVLCLVGVRRALFPSAAPLSSSRGGTAHGGGQSKAVPVG